MSVDPPSNNDVQKKFAGAKAISSDQYFGATGAADVSSFCDRSSFIVRDGLCRKSIGPCELRIQATTCGHDCIHSDYA